MVIEYIRRMGCKIKDGRKYCIDMSGIPPVIKVDNRYTINPMIKNAIIGVI